MSAPRHRATIKDLAAAVGVAPSTVSNAYNRPDQLSVALRERILTMADRIGYAGPDPAARGLRTRRTGGVAVLLGGPLNAAFRDPITAATLAGITAELSAAGLTLTLVPSPRADDAGDAVAGPPVSATRARRFAVELQAAHLPAADGLIVLCDDEADPLLAAARRTDRPLVLVESVTRRDPEVGRSSTRGTGAVVSGAVEPRRVGVDDTLAARSAVGHLLALGHLHVAILVDRAPGGSPIPTVGPPGAAHVGGATSARLRARLQGYQLGVEAVGLAWADVPIVVAGRDDEEAGREAIRRLLASGQHPHLTAVLATSDRLAVGTLAAARELGVAVPDRLSVIGFDDSLERPSSPALTTVRQPHLLKGRAAARALLAQMHGEPPPPPERLLPKLVVRGSSGPAAPIDRP